MSAASNISGPAITDSEIQSQANSQASSRHAAPNDTSKADAQAKTAKQQQADARQASKLKQLTGKIVGKLAEARKHDVIASARKLEAAILVWDVVAANFADGTFRNDGKPNYDRAAFLAWSGGSVASGGLGVSETDADELRSGGYFHATGGMKPEILKQLTTFQQLTTAKRLANKHGVKVVEAGIRKAGADASAEAISAGVKLVVEAQARQADAKLTDKQRDALKRKQRNERKQERANHARTLADANRDKFHNAMTETLTLLAEKKLDTAGALVHFAAKWSLAMDPTSLQTDALRNLEADNKAAKVARAAKAIADGQNDS